MRHPLLPPPGLYAITNGPRPDLIPAAAAALRGGAALLQYRDKTADAPRRREEAAALQALCAAHGALFVVNDDIELALACGARAVHLGEDDGDIAAARARLGDAVIGVSCYDDLERARRLAAAGADYLAFGAFFPSPTKPQARRASLDLLRDSAGLGLPRVAIGGIRPDNAAALVAAGADYLAVISDLFEAPDIAAAAAAYARLFSSARKTSA
ncbi:thiamine phosphate synthase [Tahibacter harae]|uniref:Thiamine-phosphate synthase n=1 Tax=Tahibacter harae TaxID=2963937 RepID=A0ABT1QYS8_9GAMM|nr:thiamine phosphate synthase [Tahibacter harae]MCQ4167444.1 thiamine phosphate synthase [Tahibacter harae]